MADNYFRDISKKTIIHILGSYGFDSTTEDCIEVIMDVMHEFCAEMTKTAQAFAHNQNRTDINVYDMKAALKMRGYPYESLNEFKNEYALKPLNFKIPKIPADVKIPKPKTFKELNMIPPRHIPDYLPAFPPDHTYKYSTSCPKLNHETAEETFQKEKEITLATEKALVALEPSKEKVENIIFDINEIDQLENNTNEFKEILFETLSTQENEEVNKKEKKKKEKDWRTIVSMKPYIDAEKSEFEKEMGTSLLREGTNLEFPFGDNIEKSLNKGSVYKEKKGKKKHKSKKDFPGVMKSISKDKGNSGIKLDSHHRKKKKDETNENPFRVKFKIPECKSKKSKVNEPIELPQATSPPPKITEILELE